MAFYNENHIAHFDGEKQKIQQLYEDLLLSYGSLALSNKFARELVTQGFLRRVSVLRRCVDNVFRIIPPDYVGLPSKDELRDCEINLHAFYLSVFGCFENLALVWVHERSIRRKNGNPLAPMQIGFGEKYAEVRASLSPDFLQYLTSKTMTEWFAYLENYRHALAHRIPLYIPPDAIPPEKVERWNELERASGEAVRRLDLDEHDRLQSEQKTLGFFHPSIRHSYEEKSSGILFHPQLLIDFKTVEEFANRMLKEFKQPLP